MDDRVRRGAPPAGPNVPGRPPHLPDLGGRNPPVGQGPAARQGQPADGTVGRREEQGTRHPSGSRQRHQDCQAGQLHSPQNDDGVICLTSLFVFLVLGIQTYDSAAVVNDT